MKALTIGLSLAGIISTASIQIPASGSISSSLQTSGDGDRMFWYQRR